MKKRQRQPTHPGAILREDILPEVKLSQTELANRLGVSRRTVNEIVNERRPVTTDMALRLACIFNTTPSFWLNMQLAFNIYEALREHRNEYGRIKPLAVRQQA
ncbi:MAG TPA: HigA family addiction module antitoxin [Blastocatellia bacterium]|nr:HigA family addiction module antitoxin [Blastocatellia bacterium]